MQQVTVSSLVRYLKNTLDQDHNLQKIYVSGEISNYHRHFSGHLYFTLKDEYAAISCVMFKSAASTLGFEPKTGDKVIVYANVSIFESSGQLQLYVLKITPQGYGDLYARYEALKKKLSEEGKFDLGHKKEYTITYPERIAILVGDHSAAMSDIRRSFERRWPLCQTDYYPVLVQGNDAAKDIIEKLKDADEKDYDAIILARGGGSFEDLFCFNDEALVNCIYGLRTFIVTGIGHEQDFTLCDFVADLRAATPTAAVELITPDITEVSKLIDEYESDLKQIMYDLCAKKRMEFDYLTARLFHYQERLSSINERIDAAVTLIRTSIQHKIARYEERVDHYDDSMSLNLDLKLNNARLLYKRLNTLLEAYNAENVLKRGYSLIVQEDRVVKRKADLKKDVFQVRFADGMIDAVERN